MIFVVGVMTGTSADGLDAVLSRFDEISESNPGELISAISFPFPDEIRRGALSLQEADCVDKRELKRFSAEYSFFVGERVSELIRDSGRELDRNRTIVAVHGQTIAHMPGAFRYRGRSYALTWQICEENIIAEMTGLTVVSDFRAADVASGGRGAPLTPHFHRAVLRGFEGVKGFLNLGGIANLTVIEGDEIIAASDVGPGNMIIDGIVTRLTAGELNYDEGGRLASRGSPSEVLLRKMMELDDFARVEKPAAAGRENYGSGFVELVLEEAKRLGLSDEDVVATVTEYTALLVEKFVGEYTPRLERLWISGGGVRNPYLVKRLSSRLSGVTIADSSELGISPEYVEAAAFAYFGAMAAWGVPLDGRRVTGGGCRILGKITPGANYVSVMKRIFQRRRFGEE